VAAAVDTGRRSLHQVLCGPERAWWRVLVSISRLPWRKDGGSPGWEADMGRFTTVDQDDGCQRRSNLEPLATVGFPSGRGSVFKLSPTAGHRARPHQAPSAQIAEVGVPGVRRAEGSPGLRGVGRRLRRNDLTLGLHVRRRRASCPALAGVIGRPGSAGDPSPPAIDPGAGHLDHGEDGMPPTRPSRSSILGSSAEGLSAGRVQCRTMLTLSLTTGVESGQPHAT
jgi:hypothetical protein